MARWYANVLKQLEKTSNFDVFSRAHFQGDTFTFNTRYKKPQTDEVVPLPSNKSKRGAHRPWTLLGLAFLQSELQDQAVDDASRSA